MSVLQLRHLHNILLSRVFDIKLCTLFNSQLQAAKKPVLYESACCLCVQVKSLIFCVLHMYVEISNTAAVCMCVCDIMCVVYCGLLHLFYLLVFHCVFMPFVCHLHSCNK